MLKQISDNEIYLLIKYIKSVFWRVAKHLSYKQDARCLEFEVLCMTWYISMSWSRMGWYEWCFVIWNKR